MTVSVDLPLDIEADLRKTFADIDYAAKEAMLVEMYRQNKITHHQLARALNLTRYETDGVLKTHNVTEDLLTPEELQLQLATPIKPNISP